MFQRIIDWLRSDVWRMATIGLALILVVVVLIFSVDSADLDSETEPETEPSPTTTIPGDGSSGTTTGTEETTADSPTSSTGSFLAVKVDNAPGARPQVGIGSATLLIEIPVEGGLTRFMAIYPREASGIVGPVRSLRPVDVDLLPPLAVHVVSTGGQPFVLQALTATGIQHLGPTGFEFFVSGGREVPHDTFLDLDVLMPLITGSEIDAIGLPAGDLPGATGQASMVELPIGSAEFRFEDGAYTRYESGEPFLVLDSLDGQSSPLVHETVIVMFVAERPAGYEDTNGAPVSTFDVIGGGDLLVFRNGDVVEATWSRLAQKDPFVFLDGGGRPFGIPEGSTYLAIVPRDHDVRFGP
ncbi:MAG: DUF3048 domain-containing protein [Actinobacteria bacterium]|nr:DUF3048 domain-containing protein [Actinomycetota bacterium]